MNDNNKHDVISDRIYLIEKGLDKLKHLVKINCDILKSGKMFNKMTFYYCECDPYQKNSICEECKNVCHRYHTTTGPFIGYTYCHCGAKGHKGQEKSREIIIYDSKCYFEELLIKSRACFFFRNKEKEINFCTFCYTFCSDHLNSEQCIKINVNSENEIPRCECNSPVHNEIKSIYHKLNTEDCKKFIDISEIYSYQRLINLLFQCTRTFKNLYLSLDTRMQIIKKDLERNTFIFEENFEFSYYNWGLTNFAKFLQSTKYVYYFNDNIKNYFMPCIITKLVKSNLEKDSFATINFKENCLTGMYKCIILEKFMELPKFSFEDLENLSPFQRILLTKRSKDTDFYNDLFFTNKLVLKSTVSHFNNYNIIDDTLDYIDKVASLPSTLVNIQLTTLVGSLRYLSLFALHNFLDLKQKIIFCKSSEVLLSKHILKNINDYGMIVIKLLRYLLNILLAFVFQLNDEVFYKSIIQGGEIDPKNFFHGKNELSKEISKINILLGSAIYYLSEQHSKERKKLIVLNYKILSSSLSFPDCYIYGLNRSVNQNIDLLTSLIQENGFINENTRLIKYLDSESSMIRSLYIDYYIFNTGFENVHRAVEKSIVNVLSFLKLDEHYIGKSSISIVDQMMSNNQKEFFEDVKIENNNNEPKIYNKITNASPNQSKIDFLNNIFSKSNYIYIVFDLLKINLKNNQIDYNARLPPRVMEMITRLLTFYTDNNPENCIIILKKNFVKFFIPYINCHFELIFKLYYLAFKQVINIVNEFPNLDTTFLIIDHFLRAIKVDKSKYVLLNKILKIYEKIVNDFTNYNENLVKVVRKKVFSIYNDFIFLKDYIPYLLSQIDNSNNKEANDSQRKRKSLKMEDNQKRNNFCLKHSLKPEEVDIIFTKYIKLLIDVFDNSDTLKYKEFLNGFIKLDEIATLITNNDLNLYLRAQILRYFRMLYIDILIKSEKIEFYKKQFDITDQNSTNNKKRKSYEDKIEEIYEFLAKLIHIPDLLRNFPIEYTILKHEIVNFDKILANATNSGTVDSYNVLLYYLENGVLMPLKIFFKKFLIIIRERKNFISSKSASFFHPVDLENINLSKKISQILQTKISNIEGRIFNSKNSSNLTGINKSDVKETETNKEIKLKEDFSEVFNFDNVKKTERDSDEVLDNYEELKVGMKNIKFYEFTLYFLYLKKRILNLLKKEPILKNKTFIKENISHREKLLSRKKINLNKVVNIDTDDFDIFDYRNDSIDNGMNEEFLKIHERKTQLLLNLEDLESQLETLDKDIISIQQESFEIFDHIKISSMFESSFSSFVVKKKSKSMNHFFLKDESHLKTKKDLLEKKIFSENEVYEKKILKFILEYEIANKNLDNSSFMNVLKEINYNFDCTYRKILINLLFSSMKSEKLFEKFNKELLGYLLKLLQYDTRPTQHQILNLDVPKENILSNSDDVLQKQTFIHTLTDNFICNLLNIIYYSYNPTSDFLNYDYYYATHILKVFKYYCEEHNEIFQTLFYKTECGKIGSIPFSFIDFLLMALNKIILISSWELCNEKDDDVRYFFDIFSTIVEFLIESIQGSTKENLTTFESPHSKLLPFIKSVKSFLLYNKSNLLTIYEVKINILHLFLAIIEEKNSPLKVGLDIGYELVPKKIISNLKMIMKKLYIKEKDIKSISLVDYKKIKFKKDLYEFFLNKYYNEEGFKDNTEFNLALRFYEIFKNLVNKYEIKDAISLANCIEDYKEEEIEEMIGEKYFFSKVFPIFEKETVEDEEKANRFKKEKNNVIENYYILKFFNEIIKTIKIKISESEICNVYFSINPLCKLISNNTMLEFIENVNRETRYTKLFDLMEYCDSFFNEIQFNLKRVKSSKINKIFNKINYYWIQAFLFIFTLVINFLLIASLNNQNFLDSTSENNKYYPAIKALAVIQIIINLFFLILWLYSRFPLLYGIEYKKYLALTGMPKDKMSIWRKIKIALVDSIISRAEIICYFIIIVLASIGIYRPVNNFCFGFQLLTILNLSPTLINIQKAIIIRWSQLLATCAFMLVIIYCYGLIGYFFLNSSFDHREVFLPDGTLSVKVS